jgi:hypothetical protein
MFALDVHGVADDDARVWATTQGGGRLESLRS